MADENSVMIVIDGKPLDSLRVVDLKEQLKQRNLSCTGIKDVLRARLKEALQAEQAPPQHVEATPNQAVSSTNECDDRVNIADTSADVDSRAAALSESPIGRSEEAEQPSTTTKSGIGGERVGGAKRMMRALSETEREVAEMELDYSEKEESGKVGGEATELPGRADSTGVGEKRESRKRKIVIRSGSQSKDGDPAIGDGVKKRRGWNLDKPTSSSIPISTHYLKEIIPAEISSQEQVLVDSDEEESDGRAQRFSERPTSSQPAQPDLRTRMPVLPPKSENKSGSVRLSALAISEAIASSQPEQRQPPSPARNPATTVVHVTNLVRPFTVPQIKELLSQKAKLEEFWMDKIKSNCYASYATEEDAKASRENLHKLKWPNTSPKFLLVDFATVEEFNTARGIATKPAAEVSVETVADVSTDQQEQSSSQASAPTDDVVEAKPEVEKMDVPTAAKLLDDLFKKTKTQPALYWLPLSTEEVKAKLKRQKEEAARKKEREKERHQRDVQQQRDRDRRNYRSRSRSVDRNRRR